MRNWREPQTLLKLAGLLKEGLTASQIAKHFDGVTRNMIIGAVHRHMGHIGFKNDPGGMKGFTSPARRRARSLVSPLRTRKFSARISNLLVVNLKVKAEKVDRVWASKPTEFTCRSVPLTELRLNECKWPINDSPTKDGHLFCGIPSFPGKPYCAKHQERSVGEGTNSERQALRFRRDAR